MAGTWKRWKQRLNAAAALVLGGVLAVVATIIYGSRRARLKRDEARGRLESDRERLRDAAQDGDDDAVLDEWRRSRRP